MCADHDARAALISVNLKPSNFTMTNLEQKLDAHATPPDQLKAFYKKYQKLKAKDLENDETLLNLERIERCVGLRLSREIDFSHESKLKALDKSGPERSDLVNKLMRERTDAVRVYEHSDMPGTNTHIRCRIYTTISLTVFKASKSFQICSRKLLREAC
jgi:hypothetical protein